MLEDDGFEIVDAWTGRHLRIEVGKHGVSTKLSIPSSPRNHEAALNIILQQARRGIRKAQT